jgi:hypothetical protein
MLKKSRGFHDGASVTLKKGVVQWTGGFMMTLGEFHVEEEREFHDCARS